MPGMVVQTFSPSTWVIEAGRSLSSKSSLVYSASSRTARVIQENLVSKSPPTEKRKKRKTLHNNKSVNQFIHKIRILLCNRTWKFM